MAMPHPTLVVVTDTHVADPPVLLHRVEAVVSRCRPGTVLVQLRDREVSARGRLALGRSLRDLANRHGQIFGVNDRADLAVLLEADALHLGEAGIAAADARGVVGPSVLITRACHDPDDAVPSGANGVVLSPILAERKGRPALGVEGLKRARANLSRAGDSESLLFALGGVDERGARACLDAGADGVAVIGAVIGRDDATPLLRALDLL